MKLGQPDKYQAFHDKLYAHQGPLSDEAQVKQLAEAAGVNWSKVEAKIKDGSIDQNLGTNRALAEAMSISGTPAFIIGDQILRGAPAIWRALKASSRTCEPARAFSNPLFARKKRPGISMPGRFAIQATVPQA